MGNPFVHVELMSTDVNRSKTFYGSLFNWELEDIQLPEMAYTMIKVGDGTGGGILKNRFRERLPAGCLTCWRRMSVRRQQRRRASGRKL